MAEMDDGVAGFVEDVSIFMEENGLPPMAGRLLGLLLVCDPPHLSAAQIEAALDASRGSVSTMSRLLVNMRFVERVGVPGERRSYYRLRPGLWRGMLASQVEKVAAARALAERGLRLSDGVRGVGDERLREMRDLYAFLERELPSLIQRWEAERRGEDPIFEGDAVETFTGRAP
jgi:hypothetical protein